MHSILMIFVDGLGLAPAKMKRNPVNAGVCPTLAKLLGEHSKPIDATLGVPGIPQSATGQTAMLTGLNAPQIIGRHVEGFPGPSLREIIHNNNIFARLQQMKLSATFANGYLAREIEDVKAMRVKSVTTVAAMDAFGDVRRFERLMSHRAVTHDITRDTLHNRGYDGEIITNEQAADDLLGIADSHSFTLFEYFLTDRAGHSQNFTTAEQALQRLDRFIQAVLANLDKQKLSLVITSDHGNIEDMSIPTHTYNPVPFVVYGAAKAILHNQVDGLTDVTPAIVNHFTTQLHPEKQCNSG